MILNATHAIDWKARDFALKGTDGKIHSRADVRGPKGTLVIFICNHCPYVKAAINRIVDEANALREIGIGTIATMPNDTESYPEDSFDNMKAFAAAAQCRARGLSRPSAAPPSGHGRTRALHGLITPMH